MDQQKFLKNEYSFREMWDTIEDSNISRMGIPEGEERKEK